MQVSTLAFYGALLLDTADVDGTLIHAIGSNANKLHKRAFTHAFKVQFTHATSIARIAPSRLRAHISGKARRLRLFSQPLSLPTLPHSPPPPRFAVPVLLKEVYGITASVDEIEVKPSRAMSQTRPSGRAHRILLRQLTPVTTVPRCRSTTGALTFWSRSQC